MKYSKALLIAGGIGAAFVMTVAPAQKAMARSPTYELVISGERTAWLVNRRTGRAAFCEALPDKVACVEGGFEEEEKKRPKARRDWGKGRDRGAERARRHRGKAAVEEPRGPAGIGERPRSRS